MSPVTVVTARPVAGRWATSVGAESPIETRTLTMATRRAGGPIDLQVKIGGLEDLCADAVELGDQSDELTVEAIRQRRVTARALDGAGIRRTDIAYLMGIPQNSLKHLLAVPLDSPWMSTGHAPPSPFPQPLQPNLTAGSTRRMTAVAATRDGTGWHVHLGDGRQPARRTSLVHAEKLACNATPDAEVMLCPELPDELETAIHVSDLASAAAEDHQRQAYELRLDVAGRLRGLGIGFGDIGQLLGIHVHRVRLLLG